MLESGLASYPGQAQPCADHALRCKAISAWHNQWYIETCTEQRRLKVEHRQSNLGHKMNVAIFSDPSSQGARLANTPSPRLQFFGPSSDSLFRASKQTIHVIDGHTGQKRPVFAIEESKSKPNLRIARILPNGDHQPLGSATWSSLKPGTTIMLRDQTEFKIKTDWESESGSKKFSTPNWGPLEWTMDDDGEGYGLIDQRGLQLAKYLYVSDSLGGEPRLDVFVEGDDMFVEMVVISGVAIMKKEEKQLKQVARVMGHVGDLSGAGS